MDVVSESNLGPVESRPTTPVLGCSELAFAVNVFRFLLSRAIAADVVQSMTSATIDTVRKSYFTTSDDEDGEEHKEDYDEEEEPSSHNNSSKEGSLLSSLLLGPLE